MLETLREYAAERLEQAGERERIEAAHAAYMTRLASDAERRLRGAGQDAALALLRAERDNLRAALAWGRTHPGADLAEGQAAPLLVREGRERGVEVAQVGRAQDQLRDQPCQRGRLQVVAAMY